MNDSCSNISVMMILHENSSRVIFYVFCNIRINFYVKTAYHASIIHFIIFSHDIIHDLNASCFMKANKLNFNKKND